MAATQTVQIPDACFTGSGRKIADAPRYKDKLTELVGRYFAVTEKWRCFAVVEDTPNALCVKDPEGKRGYVFVGKIYLDAERQYDEGDIKRLLESAKWRNVVSRDRRAIAQEFIDHTNQIAGFSWEHRR